MGELSTVMSEMEMSVNSTTDTPEDWFKFEDRAQRVVVATMFIIASVVGTIGNTIVIAAVVVSRKLRTVTNVFVVNLAVADLLTSLSVPWNAVALLSTNGWPLHPMICSISGGIMYLCIVASLYSLASVAVNRFILVTKSHALYQKIFTTINIIIWLVVVWAVSFFVVVFLPLIDIGGLGYNEKYSVCGQSSTHPRDDVYQLVQAMGTFPIPFVVIVYCYVRIFLHLRRHLKVMNRHMSTRESTMTDTTAVEDTRHDGSNEMKSVSSSDGERNQSSPKGNGAINARTATVTPAMSSASADEDAKSANTNANASPSSPPPKGSSKTSFHLRRGRSVNKRQHQITKNMFLVVVAFFICLAPFTVCLFYDDSDPFVPYASAIVLCNACINPIIYATKHPVFKTVMKAMVRCRFADIPEPARMVHRLTIK